MTWRFSLFVLIGTSLASMGDKLPVFNECCLECESVLCPRDTHVHTEAGHSVSFGPIAGKVDAIDDLIELYSQNSINPVAQLVFHWDCASDCNYKCQQIVHSRRKQEGLPAVKFYGKWPFRRVAGMTEFFSAVFSVANLYVNYISLVKMVAYYNAHRSHNAPKATMALQYCILSGLSVLGWFFSTVFHIRDTKVSETMDYLGAGSMVVANFNAIAVRYFNMHENPKWRRLFQALVVIMLFAHYTRLLHQWDYDYNMKFSILMGILSLTLWVSHSVRMNKVFHTSLRVYTDPYERRLVEKMSLLGVKTPKIVPFIPILLNIYLLCALYFEVNDFEPWFDLLDAHAIWHICTIFPPLLWYDWNIWDLELSGRVSK